MENNKDCNSSEFTSKNDSEIIEIAKTKNVCTMCEDFSALQLNKNELIAIMSCEGACLRGEISRRVANEICFKIAPEQTARVCLGGAFTKDTGQRNMVRKAKRVIALESCFIECASRMMNGVIPALKPEVIYVDRCYNFNKFLFGINEVSEDDLNKYTNEAIINIKDLLHLNS